MTREELFNAFREVASEEFAYIPNEEDIEYEFSEKFNRKMDKLFKKAKRGNIYPQARRSKKLITAAAAILIIFACLMSVSAVMESIISFVVEVFEDHIDLGFSGNVSYEIEYEYGFSEIPEGFELTVKDNAGGMVNTEYTNADTGDFIILTQSITDGNEISLDNELGTITKELINGSQAYIYENTLYNLFTAIMIKDNYSIMVSYNGKIEKDEFISLIESIK